MKGLIQNKKSIYIPFKMRKFMEKDNKGQTLWLHGHYGTWFNRTKFEMKVCNNETQVELSVKGLLSEVQYLLNEAKPKKKYEKTFWLNKRATLLQNVIIGTCVGFKKKLRIRYAPEPSSWLCNDRHPTFEVNGSQIGDWSIYTEKQEIEQKKKKFYLAAVFVHTGVHDRKKRIQKLRQNLLWDFKTQRFVIRKKEKSHKHALRQSRVQIKSKSLISLGAFTCQLRNKKRPNFYTGKGIRYYKDIIPNRLVKKLYVKEVRKKEKVSRASRTMGKKPNIWAE